MVKTHQFGQSVQCLTLFCLSKICWQDYVPSRGVGVDSWPSCPCWVCWPSCTAAMFLLHSGFPPLESRFVLSLSETSCPWRFLFLDSVDTDAGDTAGWTVVVPLAWLEAEVLQLDGPTWDDVLLFGLETPSWEDPPSGPEPVELEVLDLEPASSSLGFTKRRDKITKHDRMDKDLQS